MKPDLGPVLDAAGGVVDRSMVTLCVYGESLEPSDITARLGCRPTSSHRKGYRRSTGAMSARRGGWFLKVEGAAPVDPEQLIRQLIMRLPGDPTVWRTLTDDFEVKLSVFIGLQHWNRGFALTPDILATLSSWRLTLDFDLYVQFEDA